MPEVERPAARVGPTLTRERVERINQSAERVSLGYSIGYWGNGFGQDIRLHVPLGQKKRVGLRFRAIWGHGAFVPRAEDDAGNKIAGYDPVIIPTLEFFYRSPVLLGLIRVVGGGGFWFGIRPFPMDIDDPETEAREDAVFSRLPVVGGGHVGFEIFHKPSHSFFLEVGGQGPAHALWSDGGASILAGSVWYLGRGRLSKKEGRFDS